MLIRNIAHSIAALRQIHTHVRGGGTEKKFDDKDLLELVTYKLGFQEGKQSKSKFEKVSSFLFSALIVASVLFFALAVGSLVEKL